MGCLDMIFDNVCGRVNLSKPHFYSVDMRNGVEAASHWRDRSVFGDRVQFVVHSTNISISSELKFDTVSLILNGGPGI